MNRIRQRPKRSPKPIRSAKTPTSDFSEIFLASTPLTDKICAGSLFLSYRRVRNATHYALAVLLTFAAKVESAAQSPSSPPQYWSHNGWNWAAAYNFLPFEPAALNEVVGPIQNYQPLSNHPAKYKINIIGYGDNRTNANAEEVYLRAHPTATPYALVKSQVSFNEATKKTGQIIYHPICTVEVDVDVTSSAVRKCFSHSGAYTNPVWAVGALFAWGELKEEVAMLRGKAKLGEVRQDGKIRYSDINVFQPAISQNVTYGRYNQGRVL